MKYFLNGKKITKKEAIEQLLGKERFDRILKDAKQAIANDPYEEVSYMGKDGRIIMEAK